MKAPLQFLAILGLSSLFSKNMSKFTTNLRERYSRDWTDPPIKPRIWVAEEDIVGFLSANFL